MIDLTIETPLRLRTAAKLPQLRRDGKTPHLSLLYRWAMSGLRGHKLETTIVAGSRCTTEAAVERWLAALNGNESTEEAPIRTPTRRAREQAQAAAELTAAGW